MGKSLPPDPAALEASLQGQGPGHWGPVSPGKTRPAATLAQTALVPSVLRVSKKHLTRKETPPHLLHY